MKALYNKKGLCKYGYSLLFFGRGRGAIGFIFHLWEVVGVCGWMSVCVCRYVWVDGWVWVCLFGWVGVGVSGCGVNLELAHLKITQKGQLDN